jgi:hypothetical protein
MINLVAEEQKPHRGWLSFSRISMDRLNIFGLFAVAAMVVCYVLEDRSRWFVLGFAVSCALASIYGFIQGAWPFGLVEAVWSLVALRRWQRRADYSPQRSGS